MSFAVEATIESSSDVWRLLNDKLTRLKIKIGDSSLNLQMMGIMLTLLNQLPYIDIPHSQNRKRVILFAFALGLFRTTSIVIVWPIH